jgi:hypothetical protein
VPVGVFNLCLQRCAGFAGGRAKYVGRADLLQRCAGFAGGRAKYVGRADLLQRCAGFAGGRAKYVGRADLLQRYCRHVPVTHLEDSIYVRIYRINTSMLIGLYTSVLIRLSIYLRVCWGLFAAATAFLGFSVSVASARQQGHVASVFLLYQVERHPG